MWVLLLDGLRVDRLCPRLLRQKIPLQNHEWDLKTEIGCVRLKGNVLPHNKTRWDPIGVSKKFLLPEKDMSSDSEKQLVQNCLKKYNEHLSALTQYLYEDYLKKSDVGELARLAAEKEMREHKQNLLRNHKENEQVAENRKKRLQRKAEEEKIEIQVAKEEVALTKRKRLEQVKGIVEFETKSLTNRITEENLRQKIEEALDNPTDYEFAIDKSGHIYRGRYVKSTLMPPEQREKILAKKDLDDILELRRRRNNDKGQEVVEKSV